MSIEDIIGETAEARIAFETGKRVAFIAAVEECQTYLRSLPLGDEDLAGTHAKGEAAQQIAMRIGQRAKKRAA